MLVINLHSRHDRECKIVPVGSGVAGLEIIAACGEDRAVGQILERAIEGKSKS